VVGEGHATTHIVVGVLALPKPQPGRGVKRGTGDPGKRGAGVRPPPQACPV
jgi:hypothetical protein